MLLALVDTAAIFYRLRILRYYQRKSELLPAYARAQDFQPDVTVVTQTGRGSITQGLTSLARTPGHPRRARRLSMGRESELVAFVARGAVPAANWLTATVPFFANPRIAAVVSRASRPQRDPIANGRRRHCRSPGSSGGTHFFRFTPGNLRFVKQFPGTTIVARRTYCLELATDDLHPDRICAALAGRGRFVLYTPETVVVARRPPLFRPHLEWIAAVGRSRAQAVRVNGLRGMSAAAVPPTALLLFLILGWPLAVFGGTWR